MLPQQVLEGEKALDMQTLELGPCGTSGFYTQY